MIKTLTGSNALQLRVELQKIIDTFTEANGDFGLERISADEKKFDEILGSVQSLPFLASKKMVILTDIAISKELNEKIDRLLDAVNEDTDLIIVEIKFDKRSVLYKTLKKRANIQEFGELDDRSLSSWLVEFANTLGASLNLADAQYLVQRVGLNQLRLSHELEKLALYDPTISRQIINLMTELTPQSSIFGLLDAAFAGHTKQALAIYKDLRQQKVEPQEMLAMISWQVHILAIVVAGRGLNPEQIASQAKVNPFVVKKSMAIARRLSTTQVKALVLRTLDLDVALKTQSINADDALQAYLLELTQ